MVVIPSRRQVSWRILSVVFYRLWLYRKRHLVITFIQLLMPPLILFMFATIHSNMFLKKVVVENATYYEAVSEKELLSSIEPDSILSIKLPSEYGENLIEILREKYLKEPLFKLIEVKDEEDMIKLAILHHLSNSESKYVGGVVVNDDETCEEKNKIRCIGIKIRLAKQIPSEVSASDFSNLDSNEAYVQEYYPLMGLQIAFTRALMDFHAVNDTYTQINISVQGFPYPSHTKYSSLLVKTTNRLFISISFVMGMTFVVFSAVRAPCADKQSGFKVYMHLMGLPNWAFWLQWILNDLLIQFFAIALQVLLLFVEFNEDLGIIVKHGDLVIWTLFLVFYAMASISFFIFMASFFRRGVLATYTCATIWLLCYYFADLYLPSYIVSFSRYSKLAMCLFPNAALIWGVTLLTTNAGGISWHNIGQRLESASTGISLAEVIIMLVVDFVLYFILTNYTDMLRPGEGPEKPWYFIFKPNCSWPWCSKKQRNYRTGSVTETTSNRPGTADSNSRLEAEPSGVGSAIGRFEAAIKFENLSRHYRQQNAVDNVTMRIKVDKVTAICGHNGSGKSSLLHLLCGGLSPTSGNAFVLGFSIRKQMSIIQSFTSVCVQKCFLCEDMTVLEHVLIIAKLKGLSHNHAIKEAKLYLARLDLLEKRHRFPSFLLRFERRKLSLIIAMIGKSQIILIDEPTKGMEEDMKRSVWDFILSFENKTILVATSSIDEAYALGSRVAIMSHGRIVGLGSPRHLEYLFVTGYHLKIRVPRGTDPTKINNFVKNHISMSDVIIPKFERVTRAMSAVDEDFDVEREDGAGDDDTFYDAKTEASITGELDTTAIDLIGPSLEPNMGPETEQLEIKLPQTEVSRFPDLFLLLETPNVLTFLGILDWSLELYTITSAYRDANLYREWAEVEPEDFRRGSLNYRIVDKKRLSPVLTALNRFRALVIKRLAWIYGTWLYIFVQYFAPIILLVVTIQGTNSFFHSKLERSEHIHSLTANFPSPTILVKEFQNLNFSKVYCETLEKPELCDKDFTSFEDKILENGKGESELSSKFIAGVDINNNSITAKFSPTAFHAGPISLALVLNAYAKYALPDFNYGIVTSSHPIESDKKELLKFFTSTEEDLVETDEVLAFAIMLAFGFFIFTSGFILQPLAERTSGLKRLQLNTSLSKFSYWTSLLMCDMILLLIMTALVVVILECLPDHNAFRDIQFRKQFAGVYVLGGYAVIVQSYVASFILRQAKTCIYAMLSYNEVVGIFAFILAETCGNGPKAYILQLIFKVLLLPYSIPSAFYSIMTLARHHTQCNLLSKTFQEALCGDDHVYGEGNHTVQFDSSEWSTDCCDSECQNSGNCKTPGMFNNENEYRFGRGFAADAEFLFTHAIIITFLLAWIECRYFRRLFKCGKKHQELEDSWEPPMSKDAEDKESVKQEFERMKELKKLPAEERSKYFYIDSISLKYRKRFAIEKVRIVAQPSEILAIVGPPGSGKTVLVNVLARFLRPKEGLVLYKGKSLLGSRNLMKDVGYCPAEIAKVYTKLSGIQLLRLFGRLRGLSPSKLDYHVTKLLNLLGLMRRASGRFELYTDSMKRKLLVALALIGDPPVILLDDPTENLDPLSKLQFWSLISKISLEGRIVILTSNSMEELEKNVGRMAILVNGSFQCVLTPAEMMQKFGQGFKVTVELKANPTNADFDDYVNLKSKIEKDLHGSLLQEEQYKVKYKIPKEGYKWSGIFKIMEETKLKFENIVEAYYIREITLEDIYQAMAVKQRPFYRPQSTWDEFCLQYC